MTFDAERDGGRRLDARRRSPATLRDWGADAIGVNCGDGPQLALAMAERMRGAGLPLCVQPNAGLPRTVDGRLLYMATPEYFDVFARRMIQPGATMVGGCCGTTPEHVRWMAKSGRMLGGTQRTEVVRNRPVTAAEVVPVLEPTPLAERSAFAAKLAAGKFVVSVEVNPGARARSVEARSKAPKMLLDQRRRHRQRRRRAARDGAHGEPGVLLAAPRALRHRADPARVRSRPEPARPDGAPARRARDRHPQPGHHHRRSAEGRRLPRGHRGLRPRLDRPAADGRRA